MPYTTGCTSGKLSSCKTHLSDQGWKGSQDMLHNGVKPEMTQAWRAVLVVLALGEMALETKPPPILVGKTSCRHD